MGILKELTPKEHVFNLINLYSTAQFNFICVNLAIKTKNDPFGGWKHSVDNREHKHFV